MDFNKLKIIGSKKPAIEKVETKKTLNFLERIVSNKIAEFKDSYLYKKVYQYCDACYTERSHDKMVKELRCINCGKITKYV